MMKNKWTLISSLLAVVLLALAVGPGQAHGPQPPGQGTEPQGDVGIQAVLGTAFTYQGQLKRGGRPVNGNCDFQFSLWDAPTGGTRIRTTQTKSNVAVSNGLFTIPDLDFSTAFRGDARWLEIAVRCPAGSGTYTTLSPRQPLTAAPYALGLRPGAGIIGGVTAGSALYVRNTSTFVIGINTIGVTGRSASPAGYGGYFENSTSTGAALKAAGSSIIQSTARSYVWISGNDVRPFHQSDSTVIDMDTIGGAKISRGATAGNKNVMLPITVPGPLYGQDVTVSALDIYWVGENEWAGITAVLMRRQTGVCATSSCYKTIIHHTTDHSCDKSIHPTGCVLHLDLTSNNVLTEDSGILYLTIEFTFDASSTSWVELGGVRLTLEHD